jgi:D5 N terminal like
MDSIYEEETAEEQAERWEREYPPKKPRGKSANGHDDTATIAFSDIALAQEFADRNLNLLRFVPLMGKWFVWDGKRWELDVRLLARERAKETCKIAATQCNKSKMAKLIASARTISSVERPPHKEGECDASSTGELRGLVVRRCSLAILITPAGAAQFPYAA